MKVVQEGWQMDVQGCVLLKVVTKLKMMKRALKLLNKEQFSDIKNKLILLNKLCWTYRRKCI